jgi:hypothetical protein
MIGAASDRLAPGGCGEVQPRRAICVQQKLNVDAALLTPYRTIIDLLLAELCLPHDWHRALSELLFQK